MHAQNAFVKHVKRCACLYLSLPEQEVDILEFEVKYFGNIYYKVALKIIVGFTVYTFNAPLSATRAYVYLDTAGKYCT